MNLQIKKKNIELKYNSLEKNLNLLIYKELN